MIKSISFFLFAIFICSTLQANFIFRQNTNIAVVFNEKKEAEVARTAFDLFKTDYSKVFGGNLTIGNKGTVYFGTVELNNKAEKFVDKNDILELKKHKEGFLITVKKGNLIILGSDKRGTAYGILEISRMIGVSPWEWWADSRIDKKESFTLDEGFRMLKYPSVANRGIFLNDEDWGLMPWSSLTYEPSQIKGQIGPKTHARIFELLLRLRANSFWPAMHSCSVAFYMTPGNKEMADKYGIFIGSSHCEPMMRNTNAEWKLAGTGEYNYITNKPNVLKFWEERVKLLSGADNIYTLGMRGIHDGPMNGAKTTEEQKNALTNILKDQKDILIKNVNPDIEKIPQVFIPYKEVLDAYKMGLEVPDYVTLMWTDDNYGYIKHFPDEKERSRKGGNGIYYHVSYWGRPHDYLWLATNHPAQLYTQMKLAYDKGTRNMWILNVGDIKPAEYLIELFLDMAWDINAIENNIEGLDKHLYTWLQREFGEPNAKELLTVMNEYYRLAYIRKPEFMGNTREEERDPKYKIVSDLPWSANYIKKRIAQYTTISDKVISMSATIPSNKRDPWFQLVEYPVRCAAEMNKKQLYGQLARHGLSDWALSDTAFSAIVTLTEKYNTQNNGKWNRMMDYKPRKLPVFNIVPRTSTENPLPEEPKPLYVFNGVEYKEFAGIKPIAHGLGYERGAISLPKGTSVIYNFETTGLDSIKIKVALAPNQPVEGTQIRYAVSVNNEPAQVVDFRTEGRSEEWKQNVLINRAIRETTHAIQGNGAKTLKITAIDEGVILDQVTLVKR
jgi:hypothetical protein